MALMRVRVTPDDGDPFVLEVESRDVLNYEKSTKGATFAGLMSDLSMLGLYKVSWFAAKRVSLFTEDLKTWEQTVQLEALMDDDEETDLQEDPTQPVPSPGS